MIVIKEKIEVIPVIAGEIQGWLEKHKLFYYFGKSYFCPKLQILKLYLEKLFPQENLEIYAHLNICFPRLDGGRGDNILAGQRRGGMLEERMDVEMVEFTSSRKLSQS